MIRKIEILFSGANVNVLSSSGRTHLGRATQLGHVAIVCLLLDADKFYSTPEEEHLTPDDAYPINYVTQKLENLSHFKMHLKAPKTEVNKCCSPSIDSETFTCSDEVSFSVMLVFSWHMKKYIFITFTMLLNINTFYCNLFIVIKNSFSIVSYVSVFSTSNFSSSFSRLRPPLTVILLLIQTSLMHAIKVILCA